MRALHGEDFPKRTNPVLESPAGDQREELSENSFRRLLAVERKRSERSHEPFLLMLAEMGGTPESDETRKVLDGMLGALRACSRDTDLIGWYKEHTVIGVIFTDLMVKDKTLILATILKRVSSLLHNELTYDHFCRVSLSFHFYPDDWKQNKSDGSTALDPDLMDPPPHKHSLLTMKRAIDLMLSGLGLLLSPLFWRLRSPLS